MSDHIINTIALAVGPYCGDDVPEEHDVYTARCVMTCLRRAGYAIVPLAATRAMVAAGRVYDEYLAAQGIAAPSGGKTGTGLTEGKSPTPQGDAPERNPA